MSKPTEFSRWCTTGIAVEPASGTKDSGYLGSGVPVASELNWLLNRTYLWELWLDAFESTAHSWTALQTFRNGITLPPGLGSSISGEDAVFSGEVDIASLVMTGNGLANTNFTVNNALVVGGVASFAGLATFTAGVTATGAGAVPGLKGIAGGTGEGGKFTSAVAAVNAVTASTSNTGHGVSASTSAAGNAVNAVSTGSGYAVDASNNHATTPTLRTRNTGGGVGVEIADGHAKFTATNPVKTTSQTNYLSALNTIKKDALIVLNGTVTPAGSNGFSDGIGITGVSQEITGPDDGRVTINFGGGFMADANYRVIAICENFPATNFALVLAVDKLTTSVKFHPLNASGTPLTAAALNGTIWNVMINGRQ